MDRLLADYFDAVNWFSLVLHEPMFRPQYKSVADSYALESQKGFLFLVSIVLGLASIGTELRTAIQTQTRRPTIGIVCG